MVGVAQQLDDCVARRLRALEKLDTMHKNRVTAGLVEQACVRPWSSARYGEQGKPVGVSLGWVF